MAQKDAGTVGIVAITLGVVAIVSSLIVSGYAAMGFGLVGAALGLGSRQKALPIGLGVLGFVLGLGAIALGVMVKSR